MMTSSERVFGEYVHHLRIHQGLSLSQMGKWLGITKGYLHLIEQGQRSPSNELVRRLVEAFDLEEWEVFMMLQRMVPSVEQELKANKELYYGLYQLAHHPSYELRRTLNRFLENLFTMEEHNYSQKGKNKVTPLR